MKADFYSPQEKQAGGLQLRVVNIIMIIVACVLAVLLLLSTYKTAGAYRAMRDATEQYIACEQQVENMQDGSDYLTEKVRGFVVTGRRSELDDYFEELNVTRRRDLAVEYLDSIKDERIRQYLERALQYSNDLVKKEYYAMRLALEARGETAEDYPGDIGGILIEQEDAALSGEEMQDKAVELVFGNDYQRVKDAISSEVKNGLQTLVDQTRQLQVASSDHLLLLLRRMYLLIALLLISVFAMMILTMLLVIIPLNRNIEHIRSQQELPVNGSYELQYLASTYNRMYEQKRREQDQLSYEATHDPLTGLYNRSAFNNFLTGEQAANSAMLLVDVDYFKQINDTWGHKTGDEILKKVAGVLHSSFRSEDCICRIGGDEFAVIMVHADHTLKELISGKLTRAAARLAAGEDNLPPVTLSIGVAFSDRENPQGDLYHDADLALYRVKERGRNGFDFYE